MNNNIPEKAFEMLSGQLMANLTKYQFEQYLRVQLKGKFNMITQAQEAANEAGLDMNSYMRIQQNYIFLKSVYADVYKKVFAESIQYYLKSK